MFDQNKAPDLSSVTPEQALEELVGEGKKYSSVAELAKAHLHSEVHIGRLETENGDYREKLSKASTVEEILSKLQPGQQQQQQAPATHEQHQDPMQHQDLAKVTEETLEKLLQKRQQEANLKSFEAALLQKFGPAAATKYEEVKNAFTGVDFDAVAAANPTAALKFFGVESGQAPSNTAPNLGRSLNTSDAMEGTELALWKMRQANPKMSRDTYFRLRREAIMSDPDKFYSQRAPKN